MKTFLTKFKIPTLLGLGIILIGIGVGVFLTLREQNFLSSAAPSQTPQNIQVSNIEDSSLSISWQTPSPSLGFVSFGQNSTSDETYLDDRDTNPPAGGPQSHLMHYVTLKNLLPKTTYQYKIISGKITTKILNFTTAPQASTQTNFRPIIGTVLDGGKPLDEGIAYVAIPKAGLQSALVKNQGNFLIPLSKLEDVSDNTEAKVTIISANGEASAIFNLKTDGVNLPVLKIGQSLDFTTPVFTPTPSPAVNLNIYDLNKDGKINAADYSIAQKNKGKKINNILIDQSYLNELTKVVNTLNQ